MKEKSKRQSLSLKVKIILGVTLGIIPTLVICLLNYQYSSGMALENAGRSVASGLDGSVASIEEIESRASQTFQNWSEENIFGMAIEFETTDALVAEFESMLDSQTAFCTLALLMPTGKSWKL